LNSDPKSGNHFQTFLLRNFIPQSLIIGAIPDRIPQSGAQKQLSMTSLDFSNDPKDRPETLHIHQSKPFNAEPENLTNFIENSITPMDLVYGRNHGPIPDIKEKDYVLTIDGLVGNKTRLTLSEIKGMPKVDVVAALQVAWSLR
jgi:DMSO/TMAO reductase YedYZ molybdopterin-dependent catalytic subunit